MSYQVLARKWRPRTFQHVVGQEHVLRALINALDRDQVHHAFLFTGTRGVGKTTIARILAKALNCEAGVSSTPCGECASCREIDEGRFVDLIEVDAASRTKVEDTRELLENVQYAPTRGRFKIYLIDEVHMLSNHSFNALLKTLEEPPPHVKFLLATTDPQRLPVTILSRCLQFNLKRLSPERIREHLAHILKSEDIPFEPTGLALLARGADGSVRDALSLLDQAIAYGGGKVEEAEVRAMLGTIDRDAVAKLAGALAAGDGAALLHEVRHLNEVAADFGGVLNDLLSLLYRIALTQVVPDAVDDGDGDKEAVASLAGALSPEDVQLYYQIGLMGRRDMELGPDPRTGFEMLMLRMLAFRPADARARSDTAPTGVPWREPITVAASALKRSAGADAVRGTAATPSPSIPTPGAGQARPPGAAAYGPDDWAATVEKLGLSGMTKEFALNCAVKGAGTDAMQLIVSPTYRHLHNIRVEQRLEQALQAAYGPSFRLEVTVGDAAIETPAAVQQQRQSAKERSAHAAVDSDANIKALKETFNARVVPDSIRPVD
jgi:DNA polymerase-3 subunit gamma/tau